MGLTSTSKGATQIITVHSNRIDAAMAIQFKEDMRSETETGAIRVVLDLSSVDFIDSSGLGAIVASMKQLGKDRRLDLAGPAARGRESLSLDTHGYGFSVVCDTGRRAVLARCITKAGVDGRGANL